MEYFKSIFEIITNYNLYSLIIIINELYYFFKFKNKFNEFKYLKSKYQSDPIPCSFYALKFIEKKLINQKITRICDLGSGYGKVLFYFGRIKKYKIDGIELNKELYNRSSFLKNNNIKIYHQNILQTDYEPYDLLIVNDPLKRLIDFIALVLKLGKLKKKSFIFINLNTNKQKVLRKNFKIIDQKNFSNNRNIFFCKNKYM